MGGSGWKRAEVLVAAKCPQTTGILQYALRFAGFFTYEEVKCPDDLTFVK